AGEHDVARLENMRAIGTFDFDGFDAVAAHTNACDLASHDLDGARANTFQHHGAELLRAQPARAADMGEDGRIGRQIWKMASDHVAVCDNVRAGERKVE